MSRSDSLERHFLKSDQSLDGHNEATETKKKSTLSRRKKNTDEKMTQRHKSAESQEQMLQHLTATGPLPLLFPLDKRFQRRRAEVEARQIKTEPIIRLEPPIPPSELFPPIKTVSVSTSSPLSETTVQDTGSKTTSRSSSATSTREIRSKTKSKPKPKPSPIDTGLVLETESKSKLQTGTAIATREPSVKPIDGTGESVRDTGAKPKSTADESTRQLASNSLIRSPSSESLSSSSSDWSSFWGVDPVIYDDDSDFDYETFWKENDFTDPSKNEFFPLQNMGLDSGDEKVGTIDEFGNVKKKKCYVSDHKPRTNLEYYNLFKERNLNTAPLLTMSDRIKRSVFEPKSMIALYSESIAALHRKEFARNIVSEESCRLFADNNQMVQAVDAEFRTLIQHLAKYDSETLVKIQEERIKELRLFSAPGLCSNRRGIQTLQTLLHMVSICQTAHYSLRLLDDMCSMFLGMLPLFSYRYDARIEEWLEHVATLIDRSIDNTTALFYACNSRVVLVNTIIQRVRLFLTALMIRIHQLPGVPSVTLEPGQQLLMLDPETWPWETIDYFIIRENPPRMLVYYTVECSKVQGKRYVPLGVWESAREVQFYGKALIAYRGLYVQNQQLQHLTRIMSFLVANRPNLDQLAEGKRAFRLTPEPDEILLSAVQQYIKQYHELKKQREHVSDYNERKRTRRMLTRKHRQNINMLRLFTQDPIFQPIWDAFLVIDVELLERLCRKRLVAKKQMAMLDDTEKKSTP